MSREKPSHRRLKIRRGNKEYITIERSYLDASYKIVHFKEHGCISYPNLNCNEATEIFNNKELK
jgi:hypothetical protein